MNVVAIRPDISAHAAGEARRPAEIVAEGPCIIEVNGELLPRWFRTSDGRYWEADRVCSLGDSGSEAGADGRVVAPGVLYKHITTRRLLLRWLVLAASLGVLTLAAVLVLGVRV